MSLFTAIRMASNTMRANQIALQVIGQNIANANTPNYIREEAVLAPAPTQRVGSLFLGLGVEVKAVVQRIDNFLEDRLRSAVSDSANQGTRESTYKQLETMINGLGDTNTGSLLTGFFASISEVLNQPASVSARNLVALQGQAVADSIRSLSTRAGTMRSELNERVMDMTDDINRLVEQIRTLNIRISSTEGGDVSESDAVGLRDQRLGALEDLSKLINIQVEEQQSGGVAVYSGGTFLVFEGTSRPVETVLDTDRGLTIADIQVAETGTSLDPTSGELYGLLSTRDQVLGGFLDDLDSFANTLAYEFNKVYSSGQGLHGYRSLTGEFAVDNGALPLNNAGLRFTPTNGSFQLILHNRETGVSRTTDVRVDLGGTGSDLTMDQLVTNLNEIQGVKASTYQGRLVLEATSGAEELAFGNDTSGLLAALGINTFFSGSNARDLKVNPIVKQDPATFAASRGGVGADTQNAVTLAAFYDQPLAAHNDESLSFLYNQLLAKTTQDSSVTAALAEGSRVFEDTLRAQKMAVSGVSIDEEAVKLIAYQRSYQASAKFITTLNELFETLVTM